MKQQPLASVLLVGLSVAGVTMMSESALASSTASHLFQMSEVAPVQVAVEKGKESACGAGSCGAKKTAPAEHKCGAGSCAGNKKTDEHRCGAKAKGKSVESKCGAGSCGASKKKH